MRTARPRGEGSGLAAVRSPRLDSRDERAAKNEGLLREVNDRIEEVGHSLHVLPQDQRLDFRCECGQAKCDSLVSLSVAEYKHVRSDNDRFAVLPGHEAGRSSASSSAATAT